MVDKKNQQTRFSNLQNKSVDELIGMLKSDQQIDITVLFGGHALEKGEEVIDKVIKETEEVNGILTEIANRGYDAIPSLVNHIKDRESTGLFVRTSSLGLSYDNEYDPKYNIPRWKNRDFADNVNDEPPPTYTVKVGDLCYTTLGEIINRRYRIISGRPTLIIVISSPTHNRELANSVIKEWGSITKVEFEKSLITDTYSNNIPSRQNGAINRLLLFFRENGQAVTQKMLNRELYDGRVVRPTVNELINTHDFHQQQQLHKRFLDTHGSDYHDFILLELYQKYWWTSKEEPEKIKTVKKCLNSLYPDFEPDTPILINAVELSKQAMFILSLPKGTLEFDDKIYEIFSSIVDKKALKGDFSSTDNCILACANRLLDTKWKSQISHYCTLRVKELNTETNYPRQEEMLRKYTLVVNGTRDEDMMGMPGITDSKIWVGI